MSGEQEEPKPEEAEAGDGAEEAPTEEAPATEEAGPGDEAPPEDDAAPGGEGETGEEGGAGKGGEDGEEAAPTDGAEEGEGSAAVEGKTTDGGGEADDDAIVRDSVTSADGMIEIEELLDLDSMSATEMVIAADGTTMRVPKGKGKRKVRKIDARQLNQFPLIGEFSDNAGQRRRYIQYLGLIKDIETQNRVIEERKCDLVAACSKQCKPCCKKKGINRVRNVIREENLKLQTLINKAMELQNFGSHRWYTDLPLATTLDEDNMESHLDRIQEQSANWTHNDSNENNDCDSEIEQPCSCSCSCSPTRAPPCSQAGGSKCKNKRKNDCKNNSKNDCKNDCKKNKR